MVTGVCLAPSSQFYFVCADVIPEMPLPQVGWAFFRPISNTRLEHCPHNSPREGPGTLWTTFLSHLETISMAREEKIRGWTRPCSYVQDWSQREGPADVCQLKVPDEHKKSSLFLFLLTSSQFQPTMSIEVPSTFCWALRDCSLTCPN